MQCVTKDSDRNISKVIGHILQDKEVMGREPNEANVEVKKLQHTEDKNLENLEIAFRRTAQYSLDMREVFN